MTKTVDKTKPSKITPTPSSHPKGIQYGASHEHTTFGGVLTPFDFDGHHTLVSMARKIAVDQAFDRQFRKNIEFRNHAGQE